MKKLLLLFLVVFTLFSPLKSVSANLIFDSYIGLSGTTSIFWSLDTIFGSEGEFMDIAADLGLITGEIGFAFKVESGNFGISFEGLFGYYHHYATIVTLLSYTMFNFGIEPYLIINRTSIGAGFGYYFGSMFIDYYGYDYWSPASHHGFSVWIKGEWEIDEFFAMSIRFRYHHFVSIGDIDLSYGDNRALADDFIFCLCFIFRLKFGNGSSI